MPDWRDTDLFPRCPKHPRTLVDRRKEGDYCFQCDVKEEIAKGNYYTDLLIWKAGQARLDMARCRPAKKKRPKPNTLKGTQEEVDERFPRGTQFGGTTPFKIISRNASHMLGKGGYFVWRVRVKYNTGRTRWVGVQYLKQIQREQGL